MTVAVCQFQITFVFHTLRCVAEQVPYSSSAAAPNELKRFIIL